jgi:hypothetical protein
MMSSDEKAIRAGKYYPEVRHLRECSRMDDNELMKRTREGAIYGSGRRQIGLLLRLLDDAMQSRYCLGEIEAACGGEVMQEVKKALDERREAIAKGRAEYGLSCQGLLDSSKEAMIENAMLCAAIHRVIGIQLAHEDEYTQVCVNILRAALLGDYREPEVAYLDS